MSEAMFRYTFESHVSMKEVEDTLFLAVLTVEGLYGQSSVRMHVAYCVDRDKRTAVIDAATAVGRDLCHVFTGFAIREFGETAFTVRRIGDSPHCRPRSSGTTLTPSPTPRSIKDTVEQGYATDEPSRQ